MTPCCKDEGVGKFVEDLLWKNSPCKVLNNLEFDLFDL